MYEVGKFKLKSLLIAGPLYLGLQEYLIIIFPYNSLLFLFLTLINLEIGKHHFNLKAPHHTKQHLSVAYLGDSDD